MTDRTCKLDECGKPVKRAGYCYAHYMKNWRYGTPEPTHPPRWRDVTGQRFGLLTAVEHRAADNRWRCVCDCGAIKYVALSSLNASTRTCGDERVHFWRDDIGYKSAHDRVRSMFGLPQARMCADCDTPAAHWSYNHDDPDERAVPDGVYKGIAYSLKPEHYSARCVPCHKRFDLARINGTQKCASAPWG